MNRKKKRKRKLSPAVAFADAEPKKIHLPGEGFRLVMEVLLLGMLLSGVVEFASAGYMDIFMYCPYEDKCKFVEDAGVLKLNIAAVLGVLLMIVTGLILWIRGRTDKKSGSSTLSKGNRG